MRNAAVLAVAMLTPAAAAAKAGLREVARGELCVTLGALGSTAGGLVVEGPKMRAVVGVHTEPVAELRFTYLGPTRETVPLSSGQTRRQIGLKLRALDGCNLIYVMYRIEPKP